MIKKIISGLLCSALLMGSCVTSQNKTSTMQKEVTEIAIYRIAKEKNSEIDLLLNSFKEKVSKLKGYKDYLTLQDIKTPNIYIDIVHWDNIENALNAAETVENDTIYKPFISVMDSTIYYSEFYTYKSFYKSKNKNLGGKKTTEVVVYQLKSEKIEGYEKIANATNEFLNKQKGFISREILQDYKDKGVFIDIVEWENIFDAQAAMNSSRKETSLIPFFGATEKIISSSHYSYFR